MRPPGSGEDETQAGDPEGAPEGPAASGVGRVYAFVVRLWFEPAADAGEWRGEARDVESGRVQRFRFLEGVSGAVQKLLRVADGPDHPS